MAMPAALAGSNSSRVWRVSIVLLACVAFSTNERSRTSVTTLRALGQTQHVENERDSSIAHDGGAGE